MRESQDYEQLATGLADMARELLNQDSVQTTLDSIAAHAVKLVSDCESAGILIVKRGQARTVAATDVVVKMSDRAQVQLGEGPCFDATTHRQWMYRIEDMDMAQSQWPRYAQQARELGVGSMVGFLLYTTDRDNLGALNMYSSRSGAFDKASEHVGWVLASHAAVALSSARHDENMDVALASSRIIGEAMGVVMTRYKLTEDAAFAAISQASQDRNIKVRDLAETITLTGGIPGE